VSGTAGDPRHDETRPSPGSATAVDLGCRCPVLVNGPWAAPDNLLIAPDCALHAAPDS
jgi:hypothetical protein